MSGRTVKSLSPAAVEDRLMPALAVCAALASLFLVQMDILLYLLLGATVLVCALVLRAPLAGVAVLLLAVPFVGTTLMRTQVAGIPGLKVGNVLPMAVFVLLLVSGSIRNLRRRDLYFFFGILVLFVIALLRSTAYIGKYTIYIWAEEYSLPRYLLSFLLKPLLLFLPFLVILGVARDDRTIRLITRMFVVSVFLLSVAILVKYFAFTPNKGNFQLVRNGFSSMFNLHGNGIVDFFVLSVPVMLSLAFRDRHPFVIATLLLSLVSVGFLYSRGGYLAIAFAVVLFLVLTKRWLWLPLLGIGGVLGYSLVPQTIIQRMMTGLGSSDLDKISAGRVGTIWMPVIPEYLADPLKLFFGVGRYGYVGSKAIEKGLAYGVTHAHNMYLDTIFDVGLVGLFFIGGFLVFHMVRFHRHWRADSQSYQGALLAGILVALSAYMVRGLTDSFLLPSDSNPFLWIVLGIGIAIVNLQEDRGTDPGKAQARNAGVPMHETDPRKEAPPDENPGADEHPDGRGCGDADGPAGERTDGTRA